MSLKKNIFYNVLLRILNMIFPIITVPYISRVLGVENIGIVNFATSYVSYFVIFAALGVGYYGVREIAKYKNDTDKTSEIFSGIFKINIITAIIVSIVFLATIFYVPELRQHGKIFIIAGITLYLAPITIDWYFQGLENFKMITFRSLAIKCLTFAGLFVFVRQREDIIPYILLSAFATIATDAWNLGYAWKAGLKICWRHVHAKVHIKPMLVFFCTNVSISIFVALDTLMLGFLSSYEQVGLYTSPQKVLFALTAAIGAINFALVPRMSFNKKQNNNTTNALLLQKAFDLNVLLLVPMVTGLCLIASRFVPLFFGNEFMRSIVPMQILSVRVFISLINSLFAWNILMALGYENKFLMIVIATGILSVTLNWILIPHYGATGAAVTSLAAECFEMPLVLFIVHKFTEVRVKWRKMFVSILFTLPLFALYALVNNLISNNIAFLCTFIAIAIASYFSLQLVVRNYLVMQIINLCINKLKK